jgi:uncharacterized membrane protein YqjE
MRYHEVPMQESRRTSDAHHEPDWEAKLPPARTGGLWIARLVLLVFGMFWLTGVWTAGAGLVDPAWNGATRALFWQAVDGTVTSRSKTDPEDQDPAVIIEYRYSVAGMTHTGRRRIDVPAVPEDVWIDRKPGPVEGENVEVWYNPSKPQRSTLDPQDPIYPLAWLTFMGPFLAIGLAMVTAAVLGTIGLELVEKQARSGRGAVARGLLTGFAAYGVASAIGTVAIIATPFVLNWPGTWRAALCVPAAILLLSAAVGAWDVRRRRHNLAERIEFQRSGAVPDIAQQSRPDALPRVPWALIVVWVVWTGMVAMFLAGGLWPIVAGLRAATSYQPVEATVVSADIEADETADEYRMRITYRYEVDGQTYQADRLGFGDPWTRRLRRLREEIQRYQPGTRIRAWYDPDRPARAVLQPRVPPSAWFLLLLLQPFLAVALGLGVIIWLALAHRRQVARFLGEQASEVMAIPGWGRVRQTPGQVSITAGPPRILIAMGSAGAYLGVCFVGLFILAAAPDASAPLWIVAGLFAAAILAAVLAGRLVARRQKMRVVTLELHNRRLVVQADHAPAAQIGFGRIRAWRFVQPTLADDEEIAPARIELLTENGDAVEVCRMPAGTAPVVAQRACRMLGDWTGRPVQGGSGEPTG